MKKSIIIIMLIGMLLFPYQVFAKDAEYKSSNLDEALKQESIEHDFSNYKETDDQAIIYLFRGNGCAYCRAFLEYLNSIIGDYGKYFKVVSYEVWENSDNAKLLDEVAEVIGEEASGVPYIVIGKKVFKGYSENYNEEIKEAIKAQYDSKNSYDVMKEIEKNKKNDKNQNDNTAFIIIFNTIFTIIVAIIIIVFNHSKNQNMMAEIEELKELVNKKSKN